jgi:hypothetical protein
MYAVEYFIFSMNDTLFKCICIFFFSGRYSKVNNDAQSIVVDEYANGNSNGGSDQ